MQQFEDTKVLAGEVASSEPQCSNASRVMPALGILPLSACGGGGGGDGTSAVVAPTAVDPVAAPSEAAREGIAIEDRKAARAALHASLSVSAGDVTSIRSQGLERWLSEQMSKRSLTNSVKFFSSRGFDEVNDIRYFQRRSIFDPMIWAALISNEAPMRARMSLALSEILVVSINELPIMWPSQAVGHYWDILNEHAFGNFRDLLEAVSLSPAMGAFLDTLGNSRAEQNSGRRPDENFARELMQLFTIGLSELNSDGSPKLRSGLPIPTYTNEDVQGLAKVFTGYQLDFSGQAFHPPPGGIGRQVPPVDVVRRPMTPDRTLWAEASEQTEHSLERKSFLGLSIPAGTGPIESLKLALDHLFEHQNVPPFFAKQLIQRLVTSNPSPAYIQRVSNVFVNNGDGVRGDLRAVFKAVITDEDAQNAQSLTDISFGKLREPMLRFAQWGRTFNATSPSGSWQIRDLSPSNLLNQAPFRSPSVFNFFFSDHSPPATQASENDLVAPEFQIADEVSVAGYVNFLLQANEGRAFWTEDITADFDAEVELADEPTELLDHLDLLLTAGQLGSGTRELVLNALESIPISEDLQSRSNRVQTAILLIMASGEYLIQK